MRLFLSLDDPATLDACREFYVARGCHVDAAVGDEEAVGFLRFRDYDLVLAESMEILQSARAARRVLLTTEEMADDVPEDFVVLTKPQRLDAILSLAVRE